MIAVEGMSVASYYTIVLLAPGPGFRGRLWAGLWSVRIRFAAKAGPKPAPETRSGDRKHIALTLGNRGGVAVLDRPSMDAVKHDTIIQGQAIASWIRMAKVGTVVFVSYYGHPV